MAQHVRGPLYYERMGRTGTVMAFIHPNPLDQSCWMYQMAHFSTWSRCIAIDIPGYGRSPGSTDGLTLEDMAQACWEAVDDAFPGELRIPVKAISQSGVFDHPRSEAVKRPTRGLGSPPADHLLSMCCS